MFNNLRKALPKWVTGTVFTLLSRVLDEMGFRLRRADQIEFFEPLLYRRLRVEPDFFFVQVGANDGVSSDPIHEFVTRNNIAGLAVEPLPDIFHKLVENYRNYPKVTPVNVALHRTEKEMTLHRVDPNRVHEVGDWSEGIGSFNPNHHALTETPRELLVEQKVKCITFDELLAQYAVDKIDLLQIDTEGYDAEILKMLDFTKVKPAIIHFEHGLSQGIMAEHVFRECLDLLLDNGYYIVTEWYDMVAYHPDML